MRERDIGVTDKLIVGICIAAVAGMSASNVFAHAFRNPPASSSALAVDGAKSVMVKDASAVSVNPANLTAIDGTSAAASLTLIKADYKFTSPLGMSADTRNTLKMLPNLYATTPLADGIVFGLGITTPYGQSVEWAKESTLPYFNEMILINIAPTLACKLSDGISVGVGLDLYSSQLHLKQLVPWSALTGIPAAPTGSIALKGDGMAAGATLGLSVDLTDKQRIALVYHSPFDIDYEGDTRVSSIPAPLAGVVAAKTDFETEIKFPTVASVAYAVDVSDTVTVGAEIEWVEFSRFDTLPVDLGANGVLQQVPNGFPTEIPQSWDDVWTYGLGATWQYSESVELRGSYRFLESPIPDATLAPTLPDADKHTVGIGLGWQGDRQGVDVGYTYSILDDRDVTSNQNPMFLGSYEIDSHIATITYSYSL